MKKKKENPKNNNINGANTNTEIKSVRSIFLGLLITTIVILLIITGICLYLFSPLFKTPKQQLALSATKTFYEEPSSLYGSEGLLFLTLLASGQFEYETQLSVDSIKLEEDALGLYQSNNYKYAAGVSLSQEGTVDIPNRQTFIGGTARYNGFRIVSPQIYVDDSDVYLTDKHLIDENLYFNTETFGEDFANSGDIHDLVDEFVSDETIKQIEGISFNVYDSLEDLQKTATKLAFKDGKKTINNLKNIYSHIDVELGDKNIVLEVGGEEVKCTEYFVTLHASVLDDYDNKYAKAISEYIEDDMYFTVYVDKKNRIVRITTNYVLPTSDIIMDYVGEEFNDIDCNLEIDFTGKKYALSDVNITLTVYDASASSKNEAITNITGHYEYDASTGSVNASITLDNNSVDVAGTLTTTLNSFKLDTEAIEINLDNSLIKGKISSSALIGMSSITCDADTLSGKDYPIFELTSDDIQNLITEAKDNILPF